MKLIIILVFLCNAMSALAEVNLAAIEESSGRGEAYKDGTKSLFNWKEIDPNEWLSIHRWIESREFKDKNPAWRLALRDASNVELVGRMIQCVGVCQNYRDSMPIMASARSEIKEGDEIQTSDNSSAWIFLIDGTLLRLSPKTSVSINEINISEKRTLTVIRLNQGHLHLENRLDGKFKTMNKSESDLIFYPLLINGANREYFARQEYNLLDNDQERGLYLLSKNKGYISQYIELNKQMDEENDYFKKNHEVFVYTPNVTLHGENVALELFYTPNQKTYLRYTDKLYGFEKNEKSNEGYLNAQLRGYNNREVTPVTIDKWYNVSKDGSRMNQSYGELVHLNMIKNFTRRIPTIHLSREIFLRKYSQMLLNNQSQQELITKFGYRLWPDKELKKREKYVYEYTRRLETTNLKSIEQVLPEGEDPNNSYYLYNIDLYYKAVEKMRSDSFNSIFKMNESDFYLWMIRNAKK